MVTHTRFCHCPQGVKLIVSRLPTHEEDIIKIAFDVGPNGLGFSIYGGIDQHGDDDPGERPVLYGYPVIRVMWVCARAPGGLWLLLRRAVRVKENTAGIARVVAVLSQRVRNNRSSTD